MNAKGRATKVAFLSCGLGNVFRGFETSTGRWFDALSQHTDLDVRLFCGGPYPNGTRVWNIPRDSLFRGKLNFWPHLLMRKRWELSYGIEQVTFAAFVLPKLLSWKPDVIWTKEAPLAHIIDFFRAVFNLKFKIVFANGGAFKTRTYRQFDFIQHLEPEAFNKALEAGVPARKMRVLCNCVNVPPQSADRKTLRAKLGYNDSDWVVVCVAAWNKHHKRIDFLIDEIAAMNDPNVHLLLCGHPEPETVLLKPYAEEKLPGRVQWITLKAEDMGDALYASDAFVLPSLDECLGGACIEAAMCKLPIVCHPHTGGHFLLQDDYWLTDLSQPGSITAKLKSIREEGVDPVKMQELERRIRSMFDPPNMSGEFVDMLDGVLNGQKRDLAISSRV